MTPVAEKDAAPRTAEPADRVDAPTVTRSRQEDAAIVAQDTPDLTPGQVESATEYFLSEEAEQPTALRFQVNVAAAGQPARWIWWTVRALQRHEVREIRKEGTDPNTGQEDDMEVNLRMVIKASTEPNFADPQVRGAYADPADLLNHRFAHKPGIIEAIARKCNEMSGYGPQGDVVRLVDAAGN